MTKQRNPLGDEHSFVRLVDVGGDELSIVNAARVSLHNESELEYRDTGERDIIEGMPLKEYGLSDKDIGLIKFLLKNKHGSPFEHNWFSFHIRLPIFVMREHVRHRIGFSINEESGRYVEMRGDFYIPDSIRTQEGKPGAYTFEESHDEHLTQLFQRRLLENSEKAYKLYQLSLNSGIAKEQARLFLPLNLYTECRWTCNARSLMNYITLRNSEDAMKEIRLYAKAIEDIFEEQMPNVWKAFQDNGRIAP